MKISKKETGEFLEGVAKAVKENVKVSTKTEMRKSSEGPHIEVVGEYRSISKYMRGALTGDWNDADTELRLYKALGQDTGHLGGFFVPPVLSNEVIELLRETAVIRGMPGVRVIPMPKTDKIVFNRMESGASVSWGGENTQIAEDTGIEFGQNTLETHKCVCLYKMSKELLENASVAMDAVVREEMAYELALEEDLRFLEGTGGTQPLGFYYNPRVLNTDLSASIDYDDIQNASYQVRKALGQEITGWVSHPRTVNSLRQLKDAQGRYLIADNIGTLGVTQLYGIPVKQTTKIPITSRPSSNETYMVGGYWRDFLIGEKPGIRIETTDSGGDAFAYDQVWLKLVKHVGCLPRHPEQFVVIKGIQQ